MALLAMHLGTDHCPGKPLGKNAKVTFHKAAKKLRELPNDDLDTIENYVEKHWGEYKRSRGFI